MEDSPSVDPRWASTDIRWRPTTTAKSRRSSAELPGDARGFVEDYGNDKGLGGRFANPWLCWWRCRNITFSTTLLSTIAVAAAVASIQFVESMLVTIASVLTVGLAILLLFQQGKLKRLGACRHQNNELRRQVYYMRQERERLHRTLDRIDEAVADLHHIPQELHKLSKNKNVDRLIQVVQEQKEVQEEMRKKINQQIMQQIMGVVVREDRNGNWTLRPTEVEALIVRLGLVESIEFNEQRFRQLLTKDPTVTAIMRIIRSLLERDDEYQLSASIFKVKKKKTK
jgi:hypothetical protein